MVDGKSEEPKQTTQRIVTHPIDGVRLAEFRRLTVVAKRALTPFLKYGEHRPVKVRDGAALVAAKRGSGQNFGNYAPAAA